MPTQYFNLKMNPVYSKDAYNQYGDATTHWKINYDKKVEPFNDIEGGEFNYDLLKAIVEFNDAVKSKGATLYISFPPYQKASFIKTKGQVNFVESELRKTGLTIIGSPERYMVNDNMLYDTPYHLNKKGVDHRTQLLLEDLKGAIKKDSVF